MPVMLPPGEGTTVTLPGQSAQAVVPSGQAQPQGRTAAPPSPFRQTHGPDVLIMPHTQEEEQQQFRRPGRILRLARRALKLNRPLTRADLEPFTNAFAANPQDDAPHLVFADFLAEHGDPREEIVRQQVARGRQRFGEGRFVHPPEASTDGGEYDYSRGIQRNGMPDGGYISLVPHKTKPQIMVRWAPNPFMHHASDTYRGVVTPDKGHEIARMAGLEGWTGTWPEHAKPTFSAETS